MSNVWFKAITFTCIALLLIGGIYTINRLDALEAENEAIVQDVTLHLEYLKSLKGLIFCYHPDTTTPDPDTMPAILPIMLWDSTPPNYKPPLPIMP